MKKMLGLAIVLSMALSSAAASASCQHYAGEVLANVGGTYLIKNMVTYEDYDEPDLRTCNLALIGSSSAYCFEIAEPWQLDWYEENYMLPGQGEYIVRTFTVDEISYNFWMRRNIQRRTMPESLDESSLRRMNGESENAGWYGWEGYSEPAPLGPNGEIVLDEAVDFERAGVFWPFNWFVEYRGDLYIDTVASHYCPH